MLTSSPTADLFRTVWPRHTTKRVAQIADRSLSTAKNWVGGWARMPADTLLEMARQNIELRAELIRRLEAYGYGDGNMASGDGVGAAPDGSPVCQARGQA